MNDRLAVIIGLAIFGLFILASVDWHVALGIILVLLAYDGLHDYLNDRARSRRRR